MRKKCISNRRLPSRQSCKATHLRTRSRRNGELSKEPFCRLVVVVVFQPLPQTSSLPKTGLCLNFSLTSTKMCVFFARIFLSPFFCDMFNFYEIYFWRRKQLILQQILRRPICLTCLTFDMFRYFQFLLNLWLLPSLDQILQSFWFHLFSVSLFSLHF